MWVLVSDECFDTQLLGGSSKAIAKTASSVIKKRFRSQKWSSSKLLSLTLPNSNHTQAGFYSFARTMPKTPERDQSQSFRSAELMANLRMRASSSSRQKPQL